LPCGLRNGHEVDYLWPNITSNTITGAASLGRVGLDWQLGGFAADPPSASTAAIGRSPPT
jgi:hypothetical protein